MMQTAAILWHVSLLVPPHQRGLALGMTGAVRIVPVVAFSIVSGVVADHFDRRKVMLLTQTGMALAAAVLAVAAFAGVQSLWPVYLLAALSSAFWAFDGPSRQSLVPNLVPREILPNAISLNTIMFETAAIAGPALGGLVIAWRGVAWAYAFNAVSFLFVIVALLRMRDVPSRPEGTGSGVSLSAALEGLRFVFSTPLIRATMLLDFFATFFASATALLPIFAQDVLRVGATGTDCCRRLPRSARWSPRPPWCRWPSASSAAGWCCSAGWWSTARRPWCSACPATSRSRSRASRWPAWRTR